MMFNGVFSGKKVFITGHTGFKGSWLCEWLLAAGAEVHGYSLPELTTQPSLFEQLNLAGRLEDIRDDVRNAEHLKQVVADIQPDFVFHLAAQPLVRLSYQQPVETYETNVLGTIHVLEALRVLEQPCCAVMVTTDKVYDNREWCYGYRENDPLGGHDPYSSSKAAAEIAIKSWAKSYFQQHPVKVASARAGNVIGGGDWAEDRIVPDTICALQQSQSIPVRNKISTRPWQHVLEPLGGYLTLAAHMSQQEAFVTDTFNFGPRLESNCTVKDLVEEILKHWPGEWQDCSDPNAVHEAGKLNLVWDKAHHELGWSPVWNFEETIKETVEWYRQAEQLDSKGIHELTIRQISEYSKHLQS